MADSTKVEGLDEILASFNNAGQAVQNEGKRYLDELGAFAVGRVQAHIQEKGAIDLGEMHDGTHYETKKTSDGLTTVVRPSDLADRYTIYVEKGTRPHWVPAKALQGWADRHGIPVWAVQQKIAREGTEPRWMWRDAFHDVEGKLDSSTSKFQIKLIGKI